MKRCFCLRRLMFVILWTVFVTARKTPEVSSTLLKMHRLYMMQPPHDDSLYNILQVSPNATVAEIQKSFRKLSRRYHPDKKTHSSLSNEELQERLHQVRQAYEVLKDDTTRLPYHKYGLLDSGVTAAFTLTGGRAAVKRVVATRQQEQLLRLMGYCNPKSTHDQRVFFLAANLIERLRPLVEGAIDEATLANEVAQECDTLKRVPLGAQIIRCIGRAYRHAGQAVLRKHHRNRAKRTSLLAPLYVGAELSDAVRDRMRDAKQVLTAAVNTGRLVVTEKMAHRASSKSQTPGVQAIDYHTADDPFSCIDQLIGEDDVHDLDGHLDSTDEIKEKERLKAQTALLESLQIEALWKISKIDLDRTLQQACNLILSGDYFFFPSHQSSQHSDWTKSGDGWVGSAGEVVDTNIGRLRAAAAMVMIGDVMVRCSKEGTAWMD